MAGKGSGTMRTALDGGAGKRPAAKKEPAKPAIKGGLSKGDPPAKSVLSSAYRGKGA